ncbi:MAG: UDP-N-acetylglucosamine--N-acetylmuramyl-(pentapeptide) pyrophosphoryl-undecaprenol N-acetylglucosamine transferase [Planctomycetota bacterium]
MSSGTGGHLWPAKVLADALREEGDEVLLLTEGRAIERALLEGSDCPAESIELGRAGVGQMFRLAGAGLKARRLLREKGIQLVISTGGRTSVPVGLAAKSLGIPLILLEQNAVAGRANRLLLPFARRIYLGLPSRRNLPRAKMTGTPLRREFRAPDKAQARRRLGLRNDLPVLLVTGGSQGADVLNVRVPQAVSQLQAPLQVVHLSGQGRDLDVRLRYSRALELGTKVNVLPMAMEMATLYAAADLVLCRGGGCTVAELIAVGRAGLIIPYPHHRDRQQFHNGRVLEEAGAAVVLQQSEFTAERCRQSLAELLSDPARLTQMGVAAEALGTGDACRTILADLREVGSLN